MSSPRGIGGKLSRKLVSLSQRRYSSIVINYDTLVSDKQLHKLHQQLKDNQANMELIDDIQ